MHIEKVRIEGFRLLEDVEIVLEEKPTVIVGRNNSGKTSFTDVFDCFIGGSGAVFRFEDFSTSIRSKFLAAKKMRDNGVEPKDVLSELPKITLTLTFSYSSEVTDLGPLSPFIIDLDTDCTKAIARVEYAAELSTLNLLFDTPPAEDGVDHDTHFLKYLCETLTKAYSIQLTAIDPTDQNNHRDFDNLSVLASLTQCGFIRAQRTLDHAKHGDPNVIGKLLGVLYKTAGSPAAAENDKALTTDLKASVVSIESNIQNSFDGILKGLLPALEVFGFPSLNDTALRPVTSLNVEGLLSDHTKIVYEGIDGIHLPEGYNGLGARNLIYMLIQLESLHKEYRSKGTRPGTHIVFIEEPEAHLHPQMQEVFISQLTAAVEKLSAKYPKEPSWQVQFVVSTHSSHIANTTSFDSIRYFLNTLKSGSNWTRCTVVKDFKKGLSTISKEDQDFLHQYMTLTKCDLYFADKAILVEGTTERILMPRICQLIDASGKLESMLSQQYLTTIEVGGDYAQKFYPLLDFLELKTLIITDLDSNKLVAKEKDGKTYSRWEKCPVSEGTGTSNKAIKAWFLDVDINTKKAKPLLLDELKKKTEKEKIKGYCRIAYQIPEEGTDDCARSYEDALVLANPDKFEWDYYDDRATEAWCIAQDLPKTETALRFAINETNWVVPLYIREGLVWLSQPPIPDKPISQKVVPSDSGSLL